jgi:hypothetical protein
MKQIYEAPKIRVKDTSLDTYLLAASVEGLSKQPNGNYLESLSTENSITVDDQYEVLAKPIQSLWEDSEGE